MCYKSRMEIKKEYLMVFLLFAASSFVFLTKSPLHPWVGANAGRDSSVFQTVALMMERSYMPYRDTFDHKGPLLYIINYLGRNISEYRGIWVIEYLFLLATMVTLYFISKIVIDNCAQAMVAVFTAFSLLFRYFDLGNFTEEYAMLFIAIGLFIFLDYVLNDRVSSFRLTVCGICFGAVCLLRVNMIALWIVYCFSIFFTCIVKKEFNALRKFIIYFLGGFCLIVAPIVIWLWMNNALGDFWFEYIQFNLLYSSAEGGRALFPAKWNAFFTFANTMVYTLAVISTVFLYFKKSKYIYGIYFIYLFVNLILVSLSGMTYPHYGMMLIPAVVFPIASIMSYFNKEFMRIGSIIMAAFLICNVISGDWEATMAGLIYTYEGRKERHLSDDIKPILEVIENNSKVDDYISVYGNFDLVYVLSGRKHATKYSYQFPISDVYPMIMENYWKELEEEKPELIVVSAGYYNNDMIQFLDRNGYELLWAAREDSINDGNSIFRRR